MTLLHDASEVLDKEIKWVQTMLILLLIFRDRERWVFFKMDFCFISKEKWKNA